VEAPSSSAQDNNSTLQIGHWSIFALIRNEHLGQNRMANVFMMKDKSFL
jgi:hypothetical protein